MGAALGRLRAGQPEARGEAFIGLQDTAGAIGDGDTIAIPRGEGQDLGQRQVGGRAGVAQGALGPGDRRP